MNLYEMSFEDALDSYEWLERARLDSPSEKAKRTQAQVRARLLVESTSVMTDVILMNECVHKTYGKGIPFNAIIGLNRAVEAMQINGEIDVRLLTVLCTCRELLQKWAQEDRVDAILQSKDQGKEESQKWRGLSSKTPTHRSSTNSVSEEGWTVGRYIDTGPRLIRGNSRPGTTGGI